MRRGLERAFGAMAGAAFALALVSNAVAQETEDRRERQRSPMTLSVAGGSGGYLGVRIADITSESVEDLGLSAEFGVHVTSVVEEGPAAEAGIRDDDVIVSWNGQRVESVAQLQRYTSETPPGRTVDLGLIRDGSRQEVSVEIGTRSRMIEGMNVFTVPRERMRLARPDADQLAELRTRIAPTMRAGQGGSVYSLFMGRPRLGATLQNLGDQLAEYFGVEGGALVTEVTEESAAAAAGMLAGDVIVSIDGHDVEGPGDVIEALAEVESGPVEITVVRDGSTRTLTAEIEEAENRWEGRSGTYFFDREGDEPAVFFRRGEGEEFSFDPISIEGLEMGPMEWEGFEMEPMNFDLEWDGEPIEISIPAIDIPGFEIPAIDIPDIVVPGFDFTMPRVRVRV